ncbi:hypothetical protein OHD62_32100 [Mesorhizobium sp. YC-39]|uniref:hypothetical protein n=1 Tax=unclassified Mesorhizobium TaxID=325217 RepID=UPI0021E7A38E|nr:MULTISPECIES: hypothetical protein [unclassified Mesorhizobium]MCV3211282.1 hypothetical protein [Mesorhizobium sp. YC-2]MCV3233030.1 hypothetical protein [Mesorhizobium sp. YC-39]
MTLREAIEQYILWRQAHGAKFTTGANLLRHFLKYANGDDTCDAVTTTKILAFLAGKGPLAPCYQPWPCDLLAVAEQRTEIAAPKATLHLLARGAAAAP